MAKASAVLTAAACASVLSSTTAYAIGDDDVEPPSSGTPSGGSSDSTLTATAPTTGIKVTQISGGTSGTTPKSLAPVDPNWEPPACWYEPCPARGPR
ncbi:hypothetical protein [Streptomyces sp. P17]|uniref:hypothetical protein n=1 Tax=Streptomyces sp. P17 TaxID=3074716 RepID=UPI0028F43BE9|nr:hypothetical protein [Streptomyces sp. P17]MDT9701326.1 hypothetical protein [Streptomyces sp. P17]